jgi:hypothetical protein
MTDGAAVNFLGASRYYDDRYQEGFHMILEVETELASPKTSIKTTRPRVHADRNRLDIAPALSETSVE